MNITRLRLIQDDNTAETFETAALTEQLFQIASANGSDVQLKGYIYSGKVYEQTIEYLTKRFIDFHIVLNDNVVRYVKFDEPDLEALLISKGIGDGIGLKVQDLSNSIEGYGFCRLGKQLNSNPPPTNPVQNIKKFNEFKYFTKLANSINMVYWMSEQNYTNYMAFNANGLTFAYWNAFVYWPNLEEITLPYNFQLPMLYEGGLPRQLPILFMSLKLQKVYCDLKEGQDTFNTVGIFSGLISDYYPNMIPDIIKTGCNEITYEYFYNYFKRGSVNLYPDKCIYGPMFSFNPNLTKIIYPQSVKYTYDSIEWCPLLEYVEYQQNLIEYNIQKMFYGMSNKTITVVFKGATPPNVVSIYKTTSTNGVYIHQVQAYDYSNDYFSGAIYSSITVNVYVPDACMSVYQTNMFPFRQEDDKANTKFANWNLLPLSQLAQTKYMSWGTVTQEDINRQPIIIQEGGEE